MPASPPPILESTASRLQALGVQIRARRKSLGLSATVAAEAAGVSRVTLHRIEKGAPSVTMGAYANTLAALGLDTQVQSLGQSAPTDSLLRPGWIPARIALADYPQLKRLAWHVHGDHALSPQEALDIYERNARHLDTQAMTATEAHLLDALRLAFSTRTAADV